MFKKLEELSEFLEEMFPTITFYRYNHHKIPGIRQALCKLGRHDFELRKFVFDDQGKPEGAELECFYCLHKRISYCAERPTII